MFYAQLNGENICIGVSQLSDKVVVENMIEIDTCDNSLLGKKYDNGKWIEIPQPEPQPEPLSNIEQAILETAVNTEYLITLNDMTL